MSKGTSFKAQLQRIKEATKCSTQVALARFFNVSHSSVSIMIKNETLSANILLKLVEKLQINPGWIRTGRGRKFFRCGETDAHPAEIADVVSRNPSLLTQVPSAVLLKEMLRRADSIQDSYDACQAGGIGAE